MKNIYLFVLIMLTSAGMIAQPTITEDWYPEPGLEFTQEQLNSESMQPGPSGADVNWDFSDIESDDSNIPTDVNYLDPALTPYASAFPDATFALSGFLGLVYTYGRADSNRVEFLGIGVPSGEIIFSDPRTEIEVPFTYNSSFEDEFKASSVIDQTDLFINGTFKRTGDAYGTLILPDTTFSNVLRTKSISVSRDSSRMVGESIINVSMDTTYAWLIDGEAYSLLNYSTGTTLELRYNLFSGTYDTLSTEHTTGAFREYDEEPTAVQDAAKDRYEWTIFPNPVEEKVSISWGVDMEVDRIRLFDMQGRELQSKKIISAQSSTRMVLHQNIGYGIYFVSLENAQGVILDRKQIVRYRR